MRNNHIGSNPVDPATQKELLDIMPKLAEFQYYNFRNRLKQIVEHQEFKNSCNINDFTKNLPTRIRN
jgi:hypothetical protein